MHFLVFLRTFCTSFCSSLALLYNFVCSVLAHLLIVFFNHICYN
nr:MAG TPA: hypothetical protein [Inoviridae sp.]